MEDAHLRNTIRMLTKQHAKMKAEEFTKAMLYRRSDRAARLAGLASSTPQSLHQAYNSLVKEAQRRNLALNLEDFSG
jgi:hypothetical protein